MSCSPSSRESDNADTNETLPRSDHRHERPPGPSRRAARHYWKVGIERSNADIGINPCSRRTPVPSVLCPCRVSGSTVEITRSFATRRAIRHPLIVQARGPGPARCQQLRCLVTASASFPPFQGRNRACRRGPARQPARALSLRIVVVTHRLTRRGVVVITSQHPPPDPAALQTPQHHHHRHDHRRHAAPAHIGEQVSEHLIREQPVTLPVQQPVDRLRRDPPITRPGRGPQQIRLPRRQPQRHDSPRQPSPCATGTFSQE